MKRKLTVILTAAVLSTATAQQPQPTPQQQQYATAYATWVQQHMLRIYLYLLGYEHIGP